MRVVAKSDYRSIPWKNGGGTTAEIFVSPEGSCRFDWRVSIASVATNGPFSNFIGYERHIMVLAGDGMFLEIDGDTKQRLEPMLPFSFSGDSNTYGHLITGPVSDFNLMVRRDYGTGLLRVINTAHLKSGSGHMLAHHLDGDSVMLGPHEELRLKTSETLVVCDVTPHQPPL
jgi:uncharacterized protein